MEREVIEESVVHGHHVYREAWRPVIGEIHPVFSEPNNCHDRRAVGLVVESGYQAHFVI